MTVNSPDITAFDFEVDYDLTGQNPFVKITNKSTGPQIGDCSLIFICKTASGIPFHTGVWSSPDATGSFTTYTIPEPLIQILGHIEWSGTPLSVVAYIQDGAGTIFGPLEKTATICKPLGNTGKDNYGGAKVDVLARCGEKKLYVEDLSNYSYQGSDGVELSKDLWLYYPPDATGSPVPPWHAQNVSSALIPIWFSSPNYQLIQETIRQYDLGNGVRVKIKYKVKHFFPVLCNIDLCPLVFEIARLTRTLHAQGCTGEQRDKLIMLNALMNQAIVAKLQPLCGIDVAGLVTEIQSIGGFSCNCYGDGISQTGNSNNGNAVGDSCGLPSVNSINIV